MKKTFRIFLSLLLALLLFVSLAACGKKAPAGLWENAVYTADATFGDGEKTVYVEVRAGEKSVTFTLCTDKETVGEALLAHDLIAGEEGPYGLYVKKVNGILADYDIDQSYWAFTKGGEMLMTGVDGEPIDDGAHYELVYTK